MCYGQMFEASMPADGSKRCDGCDSIMEPGEKLTRRRQWWSINSENDTITLICESCYNEACKEGNIY